MSRNRPTLGDFAISLFGMTGAAKAEIEQSGALKEINSSANVIGQSIQKNAAIAHVVKTQRAYPASKGLGV